MPKPKVRGTGKKWVLPGICSVGGLVIYLILRVAAPDQNPVSLQGEIDRSSYGGSKKQYELLVGGLEDQEVPLTVEVSPRSYTEKEAMALFYRIMEEMEPRILGENVSLMEVTEDLKLPIRMEDYGVRLRWHSSDPEFLSSTGEIKKTVERDMELRLEVELTDGTYRADFEMPIRLMPIKLTPRQKLEEGLRKEISDRDEQQKTEQKLSLPMKYEGRELHYRTQEKDEYRVILLLGVLISVLLMAKEQSGEKEKEKKREQELLLDYTELVSKLMVFIGAGMTIRTAWERMARDYDKACREGRQKRRAGYEEVLQTCFQMANGVPEGTALREFGQRCKLQPYLKLSSLLEQNRRAGTKNLRMILKTELEDAFEMKKNLARRMGEEAGTKLLLPLFMLLGIVMVMIMVPAMMTMG